MKEKVYFIRAGSMDETALSEKIKKVIEEKDLFAFIKKLDTVALKTHFGEGSVNGYVRPEQIKMLGAIVKQKGGLPFLTETSTLYRGNRTNAIDHLVLAHSHGFGMEGTALPIIIADGLFGDEEIEVKIKGNIYRSVNVASIIAKAQAMVLVSHFTGHMVAGFGAALKNLGMGCTSRKAKLLQHSTAKPAVKSSKCTLCGECVKWCPAEAVSLAENSAVIDKKICIGCGQCLAVCRFDAVSYNWGATYEDLQKKIVEHAMGVVETKKSKIIFINFLTRISKDCDCLASFEKICGDIGVLISHDPVAIDAASIDLVEKHANMKLSDMAFNIPYKFQVSYAGEIGFGNADYDLEEV